MRAWIESADLFSVNIGEALLDGGEIINRLVGIAIREDGSPQHIQRKLGRSPEPPPAARNYGTPAT